MLIGACHGGKFHSDSNGFEMHAAMTKGANEVHLECLALSFVLWLGFVRMGLIVLS